jgi:hypothetical protein
MRLPASATEHEGDQLLASEVAAMSPFSRLSRGIAALSTCAVLAACGAADAPSVSVTTATPVPTAMTPPTSDPSATPGTLAVATVALGGGPDLPTEAFGSLWVLAVDGPLLNDGTEPAVHRIDPTTNEVIASIALPGRLCQGIGASPEAMWACGPDGLVRIDPATNGIVATVDLDAALVVSRLAYGAGSVWAFATASVGPDLVARVDPATNEVTATIELGGTAATMAYGFDALWVTIPADDTLLRVDPATNEVEMWTTELETPGVLAIGEDAIWVSLLAEAGLQASADEATVAGIEPASGDVVAEIATGASLEIEGGLAAAPGAIWIRDPDGLVRIDPATNEIVDVIESVSGPGDVTVAFGSVWVTTERGDLLRLKP